jgi:hypothetical protein
MILHSWAKLSLKSDPQGRPFWILNRDLGHGCETGTGGVGEPSEEELAAAVRLIGPREGKTSD